VKVGTIFEDSPIGLDKWLPAVWLLTSSKKSVSSYQLARALDITQKSAWFMLHRIRHAMKIKLFPGPFSGEVEVDETFIGGKEKFKHAIKRLHRGTGPMGKAAVMGLLERHGPDGHSTVRATMVPNVRRKTLSTEVRQNVAPGADVFTDALKSYDKLGTDYIHEVIDHSEVYVRGRVHTNGLENFWSLFKRTIYGTHHSVESFHLDRYLDDATFRFNTRKLTDGARFARALAAADGRRLTYKALTGKEEGVAA
jgi:transposase-like protein